MDKENHLKNELQNSSYYELTHTDRAFLEKERIEDYIFKKLTSKKFRKWSLDESSEEQIKQAISLNVAQNKPIQFIFPFGGYKLWSLRTAPTVDWAEFFTLAYYLRWIAPILPAYKPGIDFVFSSDDIVIEKLDNIPPQDTATYFDSFQKLLARFSQHFPSNMNMEIVRVGDLFTQHEFEKELKKNIEEMKKVYKDPESVHYKKMLATSAFNFQWDGAEDLTKLSEKEKQEKIKMGPIIHDAYVQLKKRNDFIRGEGKIVVFTTPIPQALALGTTKNSITKFWTGYGVLEKKDEGFADRILSPEQLQKLERTKYKTMPLDLIDLPNFKTITITPPHNFTNS